MKGDIALAFECEDRIREEDRSKYIEILSDMVSSENVHIFNSAIEIAPSDMDGWKYLWAMTHATALQRADAYVIYRVRYGWPERGMQP